MQCINCGVATQRLRRHFTSLLPAVPLSILARWLTIEVPTDANICQPCYELLNSEATSDVRLFGHTMVCITCGRSVRSIQRHVVESNNSMLQNLPKSHPAFHQAMNYACHPCWLRHQRQTNQDRVNLPGPEPEPPAPAPRPLSEPELNLPNYKRAANTARHCVFDCCIFEQKLHVVPAFIKKMLIQEHNFYIPRCTRVCETHFNLDVWCLLPQNNNIFSNFTGNQIEDMISIAKSDQATFNFENVAEMQNVITSDRNR